MEEKAWPCESVSHVFWECSVYNSLRNEFMCKLYELLGDGFESFESLDNLRKHLCELLENKFSSLF